MLRFLLFVLPIEYSLCLLWNKGVVHYSINQKDYDVHSQDIIQSTLSQIQKELCVKFFSSQLRANSSNDRVLYISNPEKQKNCPPATYDYSKNVIEMTIGYKCLNQKDIARLMVDMLRASIDTAVTPINSYDLIMQFKEKDITRPSLLLSQKDRNYINAHYNEECGAFTQPVGARRSGVAVHAGLSEANLNYYENKVWPLAIVLYGIDNDLRGTPDFEMLQYAMTVIQRETCIVFQEVTEIKTLMAKSLIWFGKDGAEMPALGFFQGNQTVRLSSLVHGAPGHTAHVLSVMMRILGLHMMSNRYDRDNYVAINWNNVQTGKEQYLEKAPQDAWIMNLAYDFNSATHAPANYMCGKCDLGETTVQPIQDRLWQRLLSIGHTHKLSNNDVTLLNVLYSKECKNRYVQ